MGIRTEITRRTYVEANAGNSITYYPMEGPLSDMVTLYHPAMPHIDQRAIQYIIENVWDGYNTYDLNEIVYNMPGIGTGHSDSVNAFTAEMSIDQMIELRDTLDDEVDKLRIPSGDPNKTIGENFANDGADPHLANMYESIVQAIDKLAKGHRKYVAAIEKAGEGTKQTPLSVLYQFTVN